MSCIQREMEIAFEQGKVRSIDLSNFEEKQDDEIFIICKIKPAVLQVECHPYQDQEALKKGQKNMELSQKVAIS